MERGWHHYCPVAIGLCVGAGAAGAAGTVASLYTTGSTVGGMGIAAYKLADGTATRSDALAFAPLGGVIVRRTIGYTRGLAQARRKAVNGMDNRAYSSFAEQQYDAIRALRRSDIDTVAQNTGLSVASDSR